MAEPTTTTATIEERLTFASAQEKTCLLSLRVAAQESLIALAALLLADAQAERDGGIRVHAPETLDQIRRAHDLTWYALADLKQHASKGDEAK